MIRRVTTPAAPEPPPRTFSQCLVVGDTVYVSGQHATVPPAGESAGTVLEQSRETLRKVIALVEAAGGAAADVVKLTVYLTDITTRPQVSAARSEFFVDPFPCSTLVGITALAAPALGVEIEAIAVIPSGMRE